MLQHADVLERVAVRQGRKGRPFLLDPLGAPDLRVNRWFESDEIGGLEPTTWRKYAYSMAVWLSFLWAYGQPWDDADHEAEKAFKVWRTLDEGNESLVAPGTYADNLTNVKLFYHWAGNEYGVRNPIRFRRTRGKRWDGSQAEKPVTEPKARRDRDVKWFDPAGFERYRDCGLMGFTLDGDEDLSWRGRNGQRNGAFADGLYGTGLRLEEWGSVLLIELPPDDPGRGYSTCHLAQQTAKGKVSRRYWMARRALLPALNYCEGERASAVRRARSEGRYERMADARVLTRVLARRRIVLREGDGSLTEVSLDSLRSEARRRILRETPEGLEPVALWLNEDGLPRDPHGWEHTFSEANKRLVGLGLVGFAGAPHMLRHSFALRWFSVGRLLYDRTLAHLTPEETRDFRHEFGSAWDLVQMLLGHADQRTTKQTYLEPFEALEVEMLLMHAEIGAVPDLMSAVFAGDRRVLGDPLAVGR